MAVYKIVLLKGDGIGPEIIDESVKVLKAIESVSAVKFEFCNALIGGAAVDTVGVPLPEKTLLECKGSSAVLLGAVGGPKWDNIAADKRPEAGLLSIRKELGLFANLRPTRLSGPLANRCVLNPEVVDLSNIDFLIVRELTGGIYFGDKKRFERDGVIFASDTELYSTAEIERIAHAAFKMAMQRSKKVTSVDKANVLESSRLWREVMEHVAKSYPQVKLNHMLVDNCAMQIVRNPGQFDVICTSNIFGDILSDEASVLTGSIGMIPSASLGEGGFGLYEPIHGSAPDIAGKNSANPVGAILSAAMMLKYTFGMDNEAGLIQSAVDSVLKSGARTADIADASSKICGTSEIGSLICEKIMEYAK